MTTQELIDYLVAQVQEHPELATRDVLIWRAGYEVIDTRPIWVDPPFNQWSHTPYEDFEMRIEIR